MQSQQVILARMLPRIRDLYIQTEHIHAFYLHTSLFNLFTLSFLPGIKYCVPLNSEFPILNSIPPFPRAEHEVDNRSYCALVPSESLAWPFAA